MTVIVEGGRVASTGLELGTQAVEFTELSTATFWILGVEFSTLSHCGVSWGFLLG